MKFPENFIWGAASSSYQIEGAVSEDGKGKSDWDVFCKRKNTIVNGESGDIACDHYHRYQEDVDVMKEIGLKAYRFSVCWPRVIPNGTGTVNQKGLDFYNRLVDSLLEANVDPWVTLFHWDYPYALHCKGGWMNPDSPKWFADYAKVMVDALSDRVSNWMTINEAQAFIGMGYNNKIFAPGLDLPWDEVLPAAHNVLLSHGMANQVIRKHAKLTPKIGWAPAVVGCIPSSDKKEEIDFVNEWNFAERKEDYLGSGIWNDPIFLGKYPKEIQKDVEAAIPDLEEDLKIISTPTDFFGYNFYTGKRSRQKEDGTYEVLPFDDKSDYPAGFPITQMDWPVTPDGMYYFSKLFYERYKKPIVITESGVALPDWISEDGKVHDPNRIDYMSRYLKECKKAMNDGVDIKGYFAWSIMDNFEWASGYNKRFGIVHVDFQTQKRTLKDSAHFYKDIIKGNGSFLK